MREGTVLRGGSAAKARPYREVMAERAMTPTAATPVATVPSARPAVEDLPAIEDLPVAAPAWPAVAPAPAAPSSVTPPAILRASATTGALQPAAVERRTSARRAEDQPVAGGKPSFRLGDVYAEELERLRTRAQAEGFAAGHAEGLVAAESVVAEVERAAQERLAEVQARWERRLASATAALGAAARQLDEAAVPVADEIRNSILDTVLTLVEDILGRELALAADPVMDAVRRALSFCPADAPAVLRLHPDDLAEVAAESLAELPDNVRVVPDPSVERAGAVAESGPRRIDAQLSTALARVQAVLSS